METNVLLIPPMDNPPEVIDFSVCYLCKGPIEDARMLLSCIHTFCMRCLLQFESQSENSDRRNFSCPLCAKNFEIPADGIAAMRQNLFIEKLTKSKSILNPDLTERVCNSCGEQKRDESSAIENYCLECNQTLCKDCLIQHKQIKATQDHEILDLAENPANLSKLMESLEAKYCKVHKGNSLDLFCIDCRVQLCAKCFIENHQQHKFMEIAECAKEFRKDLMNFIGEIKSSEDKIRNRNEQLDCEILELTSETAKLEEQINTAKEETKVIVEKHADQLLLSANSQKIAQTNKVEEFQRVFTVQLSHLNGFKAYCKEIAQNGSSSDLCRTIDLLKTRSKDLCQLSESTISQSLIKFSLDLRLKPAEFDEEFNVVGKLQEKHLENCHIESDAACIRRLTHEITQLRHELQQEKTLKASLQEELNRTKEYAEKATAMLRQEQQQRVAQAEINKDLKESSKRENREWNVKEKQMVKNFNEVKMELETTARAFADLQRQLENEKGKVTELQRAVEASKSLKKEYEARERKILSERQRETSELTSRISVIQQDNDFLKKLTYDGQPQKAATKAQKQASFVLRGVKGHHLIRPMAENTGNFEIIGLAILGNELFFASKNNSTIEVWNLERMQFKRRFKLQEIKDPIDLIHCTVNSCLYFVNGYWIQGKSAIQYEILRVDTRGTLIKSWALVDTCGNLSSTGEGHVLLAATKANEIREYSAVGNLLRTIPLSWNSGVDHLHHALKLSANHFLISHGSGNDFICIESA